MAAPDPTPNAEPAPSPAGAAIALPRGAAISDVLDSVTDSVQVIDANWRMVYMNKAARRTLRDQGMDPDATIGRHCWDDLLPEGRGTPLQRGYMHAMETREVTEFENFHPPWQRWFWVRVFPVESGGIAVYFHDITDRKRTDQLLREQKEILALIADGAPLDRCLSAVTESVSRLSPGLRACVLLANPQIHYFEDCYSAQLPGSFAAALRRLPINETAINTCGQAVFKGEPVACESIATDLRWAQSWRWHCLEHGVQACHSEPVRGRSGQSIASLMLCFAEPRVISAWERDVAKFACSAASVAIEHERRERALREGEARFHRLADVMSVRLDEQQSLISDYERADAVSRTESERKDEFLAILVHELRNPLQALAAASHTLEKTAQAGDTAALAMVRRQVDHMSRLLDDLMNVARITHGLVQLRLEPVRMQDAVREAIDATRHQIESRQHRLDLQVSAEPMHVRGDAVRLNQIMVNLLTNAVKYTPMGGTISVRLTRAGHRAVFAVRDDGIGISAEMLPKIFDMYSQANRLGQSTDDGLGIGLALVKGLLDLHDGTVEARSAGEGCGSEFSVSLPLFDAER
ncbi:MAG TPA: ATP-binding protein [Steroidobacteraceae bacterium]|nr:ATP-binding protein [Steroidobacteraceae bacterium]